MPQPCDGLTELDSLSQYREARAKGTNLDVCVETGHMRPNWNHAKFYQLGSCPTAGSFYLVLCYEQHVEGWASQPPVSMEPHSWKISNPFRSLFVVTWILKRSSLLQAEVVQEDQHGATSAERVSVTI